MLILLSGPIGSGKTTLCQRAAAAARERGIPVTGVLAPALLQHGQKVGIVAEDLYSGETRLLARSDQELGGVRVGRYSFDDGTLQWMASLCERALAAGAPGGDALVFVDEIGPLELRQAGGLARAILLLARPRRGAAVVVVRDTLLEELLARVAPGVPHVISMDAGCRAAAEQELNELLLASDLSYPGAASGQPGEGAC
jgi:nucleoside-triphosphatase THEP1